MPFIPSNDIPPLRPGLGYTAAIFAPLVHTHPDLAPLASPALTGVPTAPTATLGTDTAQIATTAFVNDAVAAGGGGGGGIAEAPSDGNIYGRLNTAWVTVAAASHAHTIANVTGLQLNLDSRVLDTGDTMTGMLVLPAATAGLSPLRIPHGTAHSSPTDGDIWTTTTSVYARVNGVTLDLAASGGAVTAVSVTFGPAAGLAATNVQAAIEEVVSDVAAIYAPLAGPTFTGAPAAPTAAPLTSTTQLATTAFVTTADSLKAAIASPTFTGTPAAPTAAPGTNTTQIATTAFVTAADSLKANIASPSLTGTPLSITGTDGVSSTQIATQAYVETALGDRLLDTGDTMTGRLTLPAATPILSPLRIPHGAAPTGGSLADGDIWTTTTSVYARVNGSTVDLATGGPSTAAAISFGAYPAGGIASTNVQAAIEEVALERVMKAGDTMTGGLVLPAGTTGLSPLRIPSGVAHSTPTDGDIWTTTGAMNVRLSGVTHGIALMPSNNVFTGVNTFQDTTIFDSSSAAGTSIRIPHGAAPSAPVDGDVWTTTTSMYARVNGVTVDLAGGGGAPIDAPNFTTDVNLTGAALTTRLYYVSTGANVRWGWGADNSVEGGSESGSDFVMRAFTDAGVFYGDAFQIDRATLETSFWENVHFFEGADFAAPVQTKVTQRFRQAVNASASTTVNRLLGEYVDLTLDENITTFAVSNWPASGTMGQVHLAITFTGAFTITWPAAVKWPGGVAPTLTGVSGKADHIMLVSDSGGSVIWGFVMGQNYDA